MPGTTTAGTDARFANLLEPIRDLAQNWSIDIASELEEYLGELEAITISFDELDGRTLNFVEAAMVIQGSACIYGKKVEHLHDLVLQTLHQIIEKKKSKEAQAQVAADGAGGTDLDAAAEEDEEFEPLEGTLKEVDNINLPAGGAQLKPGEGVLKRPPPFLLMADDDQEQLKMHACALHRSGALLLPFTEAPAAWLAALGTGEHDTDHPPPPPPPPLPPTEACDDDDDDDGGGADFGPADWDDVATPQRGGLGAMDTDGAAADGAAAPAADASAAFDAARDHVDSPSGGGGAAGLSTPVPGSRHASATSAAAEAAAAAPPKVAAPSWDPWAPLDPHDAGNTAPRPFRKGRTYATEEAVEVSLEAAMEAAAAEGGGKENAGDNGEGEGLLYELGLLSAGASGAPPSRKLPLWSQFEALHAAEQKRRAARRRQRRAAAAERQHVSGEAEGAEAEVWEVQPEEGTAAAEAAAAAHEHAEGDEHDDGFGGGDDDVAPMNFDEEATQLGADAAAAAAEEAEATQVAAEGALALSYEESCRAHVESCLEVSAGYHEDLALHRRVSAWRARVTPLLEEEGFRKEFDIGEYGARLLNNFDASERANRGAKQSKRSAPGEASVLDFSEAAQCGETYEVCRMFLAALQLTNQGNLDLVASGSVDGGDLQLSLELLDRHRRIDFTSDDAQQLLK